MNQQTQQEESSERIESTHEGKLKQLIVFFICIDILSI